MRSCHLSQKTTSSNSEDIHKELKQTEEALDRLLALVLGSRGIPDFTREQAVPYRITCLDRGTPTGHRPRTNGSYSSVRVAAHSKALAT